MTHLLKKGADPNVRSIEGLAGEILVMKTIFMLRLDLTLLILQYGPDPNPFNVLSDGRKSPVCLVGAVIPLLTDPKTSAEAVKVIR